ncbi:MAG: phage portal protein [Clostridia bacterium]|nr:phage portal protein [Clostridia bacterium]
MSLFDRIFKPNRPTQEKVQQKGTTFITTDLNRKPYVMWHGEMFDSELVRAAIDAKARHISKLKINIQGSAKQELMKKLLVAPNDLQTWSQFLYRTSAILDVANTCFIVPMYDADMKINGIYTLLPKKTEVVEYKKQLWLVYQFDRGHKGAIEVDRCGVLTKFQLSKDFYGEDNEALDETMKLIHIQHKAIEDAVKESGSYKFIAQVGNFTFSDDLVNERRRFTTENLSQDAVDKNGILLFPNTYMNLKQIDYKPYTIDTEQTKQIKENVFNYFGVNEEIIQNRANSEMLDAFFNGAIEPFSIQLSEVLTRMLFTRREIKEGNALYATANRLQYMSVSQKVSMAKELGDRGAIYIDEIRELFNYPPLPNGDGQHAPLRGEYKFVDDEASNSGGEEE